MNNNELTITLLSLLCFILSVWLFNVYMFEIDYIKREIERKTEMRMRHMYEEREFNKQQPVKTYDFDEDGFLLPPCM